MDPLASVEQRVGTTLGTSDWLTVTQAMIDAHAEVTGDRDWLHNDVERARAESPFGTTIAQGSLLVGNLVRLQEQAIGTLDEPSIRYALNYGFDRIRFVTAVPAGARIRGRFDLAAIRHRDDGAGVLVLDVTLELEGHERPAVVARWLGLVQPR
jgi:acyl dehydratase